MPLQIVTIPCLTDNYAFLAHDPVSGETALVDVPEAAPILAALSDRGWRLSHVLITHHHADHVQGLDEILAAHPGALVVGHAADAALHATVARSPMAAIAAPPLAAILATLAHLDG